MKKKRMSNTKQLTVISIIVLGIGALFYSVFTFLGASEKARLYLIIGIAISFIFYLVTNLIKLKKGEVLYDERDGYIEKESNAISFSIFQFVLLILGLITYTSGKININLSGLLFLLFTIMWITDIVVRFFVKRKN